MVHARDARSKGDVNAAVDTTLSALADPTRRAVVAMLSKGPRCPSDIADELSTTRPAISRHLRVLRKAGIVAEKIQQHDARVRVYELRRRPFTELRTWIDEVEAFWAGQLDAFKRHAERAKRRRR